MAGVREMVGGRPHIWLVPETWLRGDATSLPGLRRTFSAPRGGDRGGVAQLVADELECQVHVWKSRPADGVLWLRYSGIPGLSADLLVAVCYLPPNQRPLVIKEWFQALEAECADARAAGLVLVGGDINARTAARADGPTGEGDTAPPRESVDRKVNHHGRALLEFCEATGLRIANGRVAGDRPARPTSVGWDRSGTSVVDYFLCCPQLLAACESMYVSPVPPTASGDHCAVRLDIALAALPCDESRRSPAPPPPPPTLPEFRADTRLLPAVAGFLGGAEAQAELLAIRMAADAAASAAELEAAAEQFETLVCGAMEAAGMPRRAGERQRRSRARRTAVLVTLRRQRCRAVRRRDWAAVTRLDAEYRRQAQRERRRRRQARGDRLMRMLQEDPAAFFQRYRGPTPQSAARIPHAVWLSYFRNLLGERPPALPVPPPCDDMGAAAAATGEAPSASDSAAPVAGAAAALETPFTTGEVEEAIRRTRGRASVVGPLKPVVLKRVAPLLAPALVDMFAACARVGCLPWRWAISCISPIPKPKADTTTCGGHRGIAVGTLPAKLYAAVLDRRIQDWAEGAGLRTEGQFGFRRKRSCAQAALVLRATIERQRRRGTPLFVCFVDFQKAYDTVPRHLLWAKLERAGVGEWCLRAVQALYADVPMCVRTQDGCTETFQSLLGVKQGCPLSPTLFGLFIDDLPATVTRVAGADLPCLGDGRPVPPLLYADDLALMATSAAGLQAQLDRLEAYASGWGLTVNAEKTKVMVTESGRRRRAPAVVDPSFTCGLATLSLVEEFTYLGMVVHARQGFAAAAGARAAKGRKALGRMRRRCAELGLQSVPVQLRMFDTMVTSVLSYGAEVWAPHLIAAGKACAATRVHTDFLRHLLGVRQSTPELAVLLETAQRPLAARWSAQLARFWNAAVQAEEGSLLQRALWDSCMLAREMGSGAVGRQPWAGQVAAALGGVGVRVSLEQPAVVDVKAVAKACEVAFTSRLVDAQGTKLRQYVDTIGVRSSLPLYLQHIPQRSRRQGLAQLRLGAHLLAEETGRWQRVRREERLCPHCAAAGECHVQDAAHAILVCPVAAGLRGQYPELFGGAGAHSLRSFFESQHVFQLASFCRALVDLS